MKFKFTLLLLLACAGSIMAQGLLPMPKYHKSISFYISFDDETLNADICEGNHKPVAVLGKPAYRDGARGKALLCGKGGSGVRFQRKDNLVIGSSGTILFFFKGDFKNGVKGTSIFLWGIDSSKGFLGQSISGHPRNVCPCERELHTLFLDGKKIPNKTFCTKFPVKESDCGKWHMYAFSWAPGQISIKFDLNPSKNYPIGFDMGESDFPADHFTFGRSDTWNYLLDEITIYNRRLSDAELDDIYKMYIK